MVSGTSSYPERFFWPIQNFILKTFEAEGVKFSAFVSTGLFSKDNAPTRKPGTALLTQYFDAEKYDLKNSYTIGDRKNDILLAKNLGAKAIWLNDNSNLGGAEFTQEQHDQLHDTIALETTDWQKVYEFLKVGERVVEHRRSN